MQPDLEIVAVRRDESFKVWSHGYPYRTVRWHFHPEYEIHLIVATTGKMFVGDHISSFAPGNLVLMGPNLPHNWVSDVPEGESIAQRNLVVQFGQEFVSSCLESFPEWRQVEALLADCKVGETTVLDTLFPLEFCDDCGAPLFADPQGDLVHAELPEDAEEPRAHLH